MHAVYANKGFSSNSIVLLRSNFCGAKQDIATQSLTALTRKPLESNTLRFTVFPFKISEICRSF